MKNQTWQAILACLVAVFIVSCQEQDGKAPEQPTDNVPDSVDSTVHDMVQFNGQLTNQYLLDSARKHGRYALRLFTAIDHKLGVSQIYNNMALTYLYERKNDSALAYFDRSLEISRQINSEKGVCNSSANMSILYSAAGRFTKALELSEPTVQFYIDAGSLGNAALVMGNIGFYHHMLGHPDSALLYYDRAVKTMPDSIPFLTQKKRVFQVHEMLLLVEKGSLDEAEQLGNEIIGSFQADTSIELEVRGHVMIHQASIQKARGADCEEVLAMADKGSEFLGEINMGLYFYPVYKSLSKLYESCGDYESAFKYQGFYGEAQDSLLDVSQAQLISDNLRKWEEQSFNEANVSLPFKNQEGKWLWVVIAGVGLTGVIVVFLFVFRSKQRKRTKHLEEEAEHIRREAEVTRQTLDAASKELASIAKDESGTMVCMDKSELVSILRSEKLVTKTNSERFKSRFEITEPGLLYRLRNEYPEMTAAEERMFCLIRLNFSNSELGEIMGVSMNTVKSYRQRLRKRLELGSASNLDDFIIRY